MFSFFKKRAKRKPIKLLDMTLDHSKNVLATLVDELAPILKDEKVMTFSTDVVQGEKETNYDYGVRMAEVIMQAISMFAVQYQQNIYRVFAAFFQVSPDDVGKLSTREIIEQLKVSLKDEDLIGFLSPPKSLAKRTLPATLVKPTA